MTIYRRFVAFPDLDHALVAIVEIALQVGLPAARIEEADPGLLLVPHHAELPDAEGAAVRRLVGPELEVRVVRAGLGINRLPHLVLAAPGLHPQEIEVAAAAAMQDDEADVVFRADLPDVVAGK